MRYGFTSESVSFVNRVLDVLARSGINSTTYGGPIRDKETETQFNLAMGGSPAYGYKNLPLMAMLWVQADLDTDWGGDSEGVYEKNGEWPWVANAWYSTIDAERKGTFPANADEMEYEDIIQDAFGLIVELENKIWLAVLVANAIRALEGDTRNAFDAYPEILAEFAKERDSVKQTTREWFSDNDFLKKFV